MFKKPITWVVLLALFTASLMFTVRNFTKAFPAINLRVSMDRSQAIAEGRRLAERYGWGPSGARAAAAFDNDGQLQDFVELEGGGKAAFADMIRGSLFSPYVWRVRLFKEHEVNETEIRFTPLGRPLGFRESLSENQPGPTLSEAEARARAEKSLVRDWDLDLDPYRLVESAHEARPGGRTDYTFIYERKNERVGEGRYRLRAVVSGDRLTEVTPFVKIPEAFERRYEQMRSANNTIAMADSVVIYVGYFGVGCLVSLFFLIRRRYLLWRKAILFGTGIALLGMLSGLNNLPLAWMYYETAQSERVFLNGGLAQALSGFLMMSAMLSVSFMVAESLTRKAFPRLIQFWRVWDRDVAGTTDVGGQTAGAYLLVGFLLAYDVALYLFANRLLGWWSPSEPLIDPNILAVCVPWLGPLAASSQAGFWEECLFRAVPLACAALIGQRYGRRNLWIGVALVAQAVIFGAAHANYPQQPAYARIVEMIPSFMLFGLIYLWFGLLPVIVAHYTVDMIYMSMPLFFTDISGIWLHRSAAVALVSVPALVVLCRVAIQRKWLSLPEGAVNAAWLPAAHGAPAGAETVAGQPPQRAFTRGAVGFWAAAGLAGLALWISATDFSRYTSPLTPTRREAETMADACLAGRGFSIAEDWDRTAAVSAQQDEAERYVWQTQGPDMYRRLLKDGYLDDAAWEIRRLRFSSRIDVAERAEVFGVALRGTGAVSRVYHTLPEGRAGRDLGRDESREVEERFLKNEMSVDPRLLKEIAVTPSKRQNRTDWLFTYGVTNYAGLTNDEIRIDIQVADGSVVDGRRYLHVPETWSREEQNRLAGCRIVETLCLICIVMLFLAGAVMGIVQWSHGRFAVGVFLRLFAILAACAVAAFVNGWPACVAAFSTSEPFRNQVVAAMAQQIGVATLVGAIIALAGGQAVGWRGWDGTDRRSGFVVAAGCGFAFAGAVAALSHFVPQWAPFLPDYGGAGKFVPLAKPLLTEVAVFVARTAFMVCAFAALNRGTRWTAVRVTGNAVALLLLGLLLSGLHEVHGLGIWCLQGVTVGAALFVMNRWVFSVRPALIPLAVAVATSLGAVRESVFDAYPGAAAGYLLAVATILFLACVWSQWMEHGPWRAA